MLTSKKPVTVKEKGVLSAERWCHYFIFVCYTVVIVNLAVLIAVWYFFALGRVSTTPAVYWVKYIIVPSCVMLIANVAAHLLVKSKRLSIVAKEYVSMFLMLFFCAYLCATHSIVAVLLACFIVPVMASTIFSNARMTGVVYALSQILIILCGIKMYFFSTRAFGPWIWMETLTASGILMGSFLMARVFIVYGKDNISTIRNIYNDNISLEERLRLDPLLGLYNRKAYDEYLPQLMEECRLKGAPLSIAVLDIDDFKQVNDAYGHAAGDRVLLKVSEIVKEHMPENIYVFRIGGEEFVFLFDGYRVEEAAKVCEDLLSIIRESSLPEVEDTRLSFSCGIAGMGQRLADPAGLFKAADAALYSAKNGGKNKVVMDESGNAR